MHQPYILGIAGGSGSGKTTFCRMLTKRLGFDICETLAQDSYYIDQSAKFDHDGGNVNFDHPESLDFPLMAAHLRNLRRGRAVTIPIYDFVTHQRLPQGNPFSPKPIILVDGILILSQPAIREHLDAAVFIDIPEEIRFKRRLDRDVIERGRTPEGVREQFFAQVKPMHETFVQPSKDHAHHVAFDNQSFDQLLDKMVSQLHDHIKAWKAMNRAHQRSELSP